MQTFMPYPDPTFEESARALDMRRLGKQRVEAWQILGVLAAKRALPRAAPPWGGHPAVLMWEGYDVALRSYYNEMLREWGRRGYRNLKLQPMSLESDHPSGCMIRMPPWVGDQRLHASHRSNLLRKDPAHYGGMGWREGPGLPYWWPLGDHYDVSGWSSGRASGAE